MERTGVVVLGVDMSTVVQAEVVGACTGQDACELDGVEACDWASQNCPASWWEQVVASQLEHLVGC